MSAHATQREPSELTSAALARLQREVRLLKFGLAAALLLVFVCGANAVLQKPKFEEIDVERLNIVEADGKLRMVISNQARFPDVLLDGKTIKGRQGGKMAGMLFYNDKGECGGLSFGSTERAGGHAANAGLMFDQYRQDQTIGLQYSENNGRQSAGLRVWDRPDAPLTELLDKIEAIKKLPEGPEKKEATEKLQQSAVTATRVVVGKSESKAAVIMLADAKGRPRIRITVDATGDSRLEFLDEKGGVIHRLPPDAEKGK